MEVSDIKIPTRPERRLLPDDFDIDSWEGLKVYLDQLDNREPVTTEELKAWLKDLSEVYSVLSENRAWRYIRMTIDTTDEKASEAYSWMIKEIIPNISPYSDRFNRKLAEHPQASSLTEEGYDIYLRGVRKAIEIYREENVPLFSEDREQAREFGAVSAAMSIEWEGEQLTMQQAAAKLRDPDRAKREEIYTKIKNRRLQEVDKLHDLYSKLVERRHRIAKNAGYENFRDYKFDALGRFDYTVEDCFSFHKAIAEEIVPIVREFHQDRKEKLGCDTLRPWDLDVDASGQAPLTPFKDGAELIDKTIQVFHRLRPYFGECLEVMREMKYLDLESKKGKAPGGYNYTLDEIGVPFIFMNAVGTPRDVITMVHEGGHALHSFLTRELDLISFKNYPSEVAELASMAMELLSMEHWDVFYPDPADLKRARREQLERSLNMLPWVAPVSEFQHWVYENPGHSAEERTEAWTRILKRYGTGVIDYTGQEDRLKTQWQSQLHIFEMPFYYIEYGMAQLGAIAIWRNFKKNPEVALDQYIEGLKLGYTRSIPEIYKAAGISFDFSPEYVRELAAFVRSELDLLR